MPLCMLRLILGWTVMNYHTFHLHAIALAYSTTGSSLAGYPQCMVQLCVHVTVLEEINMICVPLHVPASMLLQAIPSGTAHRPHLTSPPNPTVYTVVPFTWVWYNLYTLLQTYTFSNCTKLWWNCYTVYQCTTDSIFIVTPWHALQNACMTDHINWILEHVCRIGVSVLHTTTYVHTHTHHAHTV